MVLWLHHVAFSVLRVLHSEEHRRGHSDGDSVGLLALPRERRRVALDILNTGLKLEASVVNEVRGCQWDRINATL
jgi:hypothetical protein